MNTIEIFYKFKNDFFNESDYDENDIIQLTAFEVIEYQINNYFNDATDIKANFKSSLYNSIIIDKQQVFIVLNNKDAMEIIKKYDNDLNKTIELIINNYRNNKSSYNTLIDLASQTANDIFKIQLLDLIDDFTQYLFNSVDGAKK
jgi:hypothetical protein